MKGTDHLAPELHDPAVGQRRLLHATTRAVARFEDDHVRPSGHQIARGAEAGQPGANHNHVRFHGGILS